MKPVNFVFIFLPRKTPARCNRTLTAVDGRQSAWKRGGGLQLVLEVPQDPHEQEEITIHRSGHGEEEGALRGFKRGPVLSLQNQTVMRAGKFPQFAWMKDFFPPEKIR